MNRLIRLFHWNIMGQQSQLKKTHIKQWLFLNVLVSNGVLSDCCSPVVNILFDYGSIQVSFITKKKKKKIASPWTFSKETFACIPSWIEIVFQEFLNKCQYVREEYGGFEDEAVWENDRKFQKQNAAESAKLNLLKPRVI